LSLLIADNDQQTVLVATENGFRQTHGAGRFPPFGRGTQGVIAIAASERNGKVVAARLVSDDDEIMLITTGGVLIRTRVREIRELGRATQGVTLIALDAGEKLAGLEKVVESEEEAERAGQRAGQSRREPGARIQALTRAAILPLIPNRSDASPLAIGPRSSLRRASARWPWLCRRRRRARSMSDDLQRELALVRQQIDASTGNCSTAEPACAFCAAGRRDQGASR
jgi:hypothetical protein